MLVNISNLLMKAANLWCSQFGNVYELENSKI